MKKHQKFAAMQIAAFSTKLGWMAVMWSESAVSRLVFGYSTEKLACLACGDAPTRGRELTLAQRALAERLRLVAKGVRQDFADIQVDLTHLSTFQRRVLSRCRSISWGCTKTYGELAAECGSPGAARAVGGAMARNPIPLIIPCHRIVAANGGIGGFSAPQGTSMKKQLLAMERCSSEREVGK
jgi:methylated-DNA-[protein]-cysteine S-methyltransferase